MAQPSSSAISKIQFAICESAVAIDRVQDKRSEIVDAIREVQFIPVLIFTCS